VHLAPFGRSAAHADALYELSGPDSAFRLRVGVTPELVRF